MFNLKGWKNIRKDRGAFMVNIGAAVILGYAMMATATISFWFNRMGWFQDGIMGNLWTLAPIVFGLGATIIITRLTQDPKIIVGGGIFAAIFYYLFFVMETL